ncbi:hypothetical protein [Stenotrophomonas acidaminiphila]|jgi:hypothetical protein
MPYHSTAKIERLEKRLQERFDHLVKVVNGSEVSPKYLPSHSTGPHRSVFAEDVRIAVDDFSTILKEIKASLGKR